MTANEQLYDALDRRDLNAAHAALAAGASVEDRSQTGKVSLFFHFLSEGNIPAARWLKEQGCDVNAVDQLGDTVLLHLLERNLLNEFSAAVDMGVDINRANDRGITPVIRASLFKFGKPFLQLLLEHGANPSAVSESRNTALMAACSEGFEEMADMLMAAQADPRGVDEHGHNVIHAAVMSRKPRLLKKILEYTQEYRARGEISIDGDRAALSKPMAYAAMLSPEMTVMLLQEGADPNAQSKNRLHPGMTPLMMLAIADEDGEASLTKLALAKGAVPGFRDYQGGNAFRYAVARGLAGKHAVLKTLIEAGLDPKAPISADAFSPLHVAMLYEQPLDEDGNPEGPDRFAVLEALMDLGFPSLPRLWVDPLIPEDERPNRLPPPLLLALARKDLAAARVLLEKGSSVNELDDEGFSVLHRLAAVTGLSQQEKLAMMLTSRALADVEAQEKARQAKAAGKTEEAPPAPAPAKPSKRQQQLEEARRQMEELRAQARLLVAVSAQWLSEHGADWGLRGHQGQTPGMGIAREDGVLMLGQLVRFHGLDLTLRDEFDRTALDHALLSLSGETLFALVEHVSRQAEGWTPYAQLLVNAAYESPEYDPQVKGSLERRAQFIGLVSALPRDPALLEGRDADGNTALIVAAATGQDDLVRVLLAMGADPNAQNALGETAIMQAIANDQPDIARMCRKAGGDVGMVNTAGQRVLDFPKARQDRNRWALEVPESELSDLEPIKLSDREIQQVEQWRRAWDDLMPAAANAVVARKKLVR